MRLFQNSHFSFFEDFSKFFRIFLMTSKGPPFKFFLIFCNKLDFQKLETFPLFTILKTLRFLSLRYSADFRRFRLVELAVQRLVVKISDFKAVRSPCLRFLKMNFVSVPPPVNAWTVNDEYEADHFLHYIKTELLNADGFGHIIVYGSSVDAYCCLRVLLNCGVKGVKILFARKKLEPDEPTTFNNPLVS